MPFGRQRAADMSSNSAFYFFIFFLIYERVVSKVLMALTFSNLCYSEWERGKTKKKTEIQLIYLLKI